MARKAIIGDIKVESKNALMITWSIPNFFSRALWSRSFTQNSPSFQFFSATWCFRLYPRGRNYSNSFQGNCLDISVVRSNSDEERFSCEFALKRVYNGEVSRAAQILDFKNRGEVAIEKLSVLKDYVNTISGKDNLILECCVLCHQSKVVDAVQGAINASLGRGRSFNSMGNRDVVGDLRLESEITKVVTWNIPNYFSRAPYLVGYHEESPAFQFENAVWCLRLYPNGKTKNRCEGDVNISIVRSRSQVQHHAITCDIAIKLANKKEESRIVYILDVKEDGEKMAEDIGLWNLYDKWNANSSQDVLIIECCLLCMKSKEVNAVPQDSGKDCKQSKSADAVPQNSNKSCKESKGVDAVPQNLKRDLKESKGVEAVPQNLNKDRRESKIMNAVLQDLVKDNKYLCCRDFKNILLNGQDHNLVLKVGNKDFRAHQDILRARSPVFQSMLSHDMLEKASGAIDVPDCDPQAFEQLLVYIYSGEVEKLDESNMLGLYYAADKYDIGKLKEQSREFIKKRLSITNVCHVIQLAVKHSDSDLLRCATEFFSSNMDAILATVEWQSFIIENPTQANELMIKSVKSFKEKCKKGML